MAVDNRTVYVANYLRNSIQFVDIGDRRVIEEVHLGGPAEPSLARQGMAIFYDGRRSLDQWYSCHSCHQDGGTNSRPMDTMNDGTAMTMKTVLPLYNVTQTKPWTWHGWQEDLGESFKNSLVSTMQGKPPSKADTHAMLAYLKTLEPPPNPFRNFDGSLTEAAERGRLVFESEQAGCANCHTGPNFTDGQIHDVGLGKASDAYDGYNTPTLLGVYRKVRLLHSGRARDLERVIDDLHSPETVSGTKNLTEQNRDDLIAYLKSL